MHSCHDFFTVRKSWLISNLSRVSGGVAPIRSHAFSIGRWRPLASLLGMWLNCCPDGLPHPALWVPALRWWRSLGVLASQLNLSPGGVDRMCPGLNGIPALHPQWCSGCPHSLGGHVFLQKALHSWLAGASHRSRLTPPPPWPPGPPQGPASCLQTGSSSPAPAAPSLGTVWAHPFSPLTELQHHW